MKQTKKNLLLLLLFVGLVGIASGAGGYAIAQDCPKEVTCELITPIECPTLEEIREIVPLCPDCPDCVLEAPNEPVEVEPPCCPERYLIVPSTQDASPAGWSIGVGPYFRYERLSGSVRGEGYHGEYSRSFKSSGLVPGVMVQFEPPAEHWRFGATLDLDGRDIRASSPTKAGYAEARGTVGVYALYVF